MKNLIVWCKYCKKNKNKRATTRFISEENKLTTQSLLLYFREKTEDSLLHTCRHGA